MYDITKNEFQELTPLPYPVFEMATVKWGDDSVMIMGGADRDCQPLNKVLMYNIKTQKIQMLPDMKYKRTGCVAAVVKDTVIVMGGKNEKRNFLKSVESFRFDRYSWEELQKCMKQDAMLVLLHVNCACPVLCIPSNKSYNYPPPPPFLIIITRNLLTTLNINLPYYFLK